MEKDAQMDKRSTPDQPDASSPTVGGHEKRWLRTDRVLLVVATGLLFWIAGDVLLLVFAGVLMAVGLDGAAGAISRHSPLSRLWALVLVLLGALATLAWAAIYMATPLVEQFGDVWERMTGFIDAGMERLADVGWAQPFLPDGDGNSDQVAESAGEVVGHVANATWMVFGALGSVILVAAIALFTAFNPPLYRDGLLKLFPHPFRERLDRALGAIAHALRWWFLGQFASMLLLGITVSVGLLLIGVEGWLGLGLLTALLTFIPYIGPLIAAVPILLVAFADSTQVGLTVLVFYLIVQNLEGNLIVPLIQHRAVHLAPAVLISVQVLMGVLFGLLGVIVAAPLTVVAMVAVNKLYVEDVLGETTQS